jgi:hypothetical protein
VLNAFLSTWSNARQTFDGGTSQSGTRYDNCAALRQAQSNAGISPPADTDFQNTLNDALNDAVGKDNNPAAKIAQKYEDIIKIPGGKK